MLKIFFTQGAPKYILPKLNNKLLKLLHDVPVLKVFFYKDAGSLTYIIL